MSNSNCTPFHVLINNIQKPLEKLIKIDRNHKSAPKKVMEVSRHLLNNTSKSVKESRKSNKSGGVDESFKKFQSIFIACYDAVKRKGMSEKGARALITGLLFMRVMGSYIASPYERGVIDNKKLQKKHPTIGGTAAQDLYQMWKYFGNESIKGEEIKIHSKYAYAKDLLNDPEIKSQMEIIFLLLVPPHLRAT